MFAYGNQQLMVVLEGKLNDSTPDEVIETLEEILDEITWPPTDAIEIVSNKPAQLIAASATWTPRASLVGTGPSAELMRELARAPEDAYFIAGFVPRPEHEALVKAGAVWLYPSGGKLVAETRLDTADEEDATELVDNLTTGLDELADEAQEHCGEHVGTIVTATRFARHGAIVTGRVEIARSTMLGVIQCALDD